MCSSTCEIFDELPFNRHSVLSQFPFQNQASNSPLPLSQEIYEVANNQLVYKVCQRFGGFLGTPKYVLLSHSFSPGLSNPDPLRNLHSLLDAISPSLSLPRMII